MLDFYPTLGAWYVTLMSVGFVLICVLLMLVVLIQRPRGGGLAGAFGGAGGGAQAAFGTKTGDVLTWFTVGCFVLFLVLAMGLTWAIHPGSSEPPVLDTPAGTPAEQAPAAPAPTTSTPDQPQP